MWKKKYDMLQQYTAKVAQSQEFNIRKEERDKCQKEIQELILNQEMEKLVIKKQLKDEYEHKIDEIIAVYEINKKKEIEKIMKEVEERMKREEREQKETKSQTS